MISTAKRGCAVEYKACLAFLEAGFEVFPNMAPDGAADLIVWDKEQAYPIDTKKLTKYTKKDGSVAYSAHSVNKHSNVYYLGWHEDGWIWLSEPPEALKGVL